MRTEVLAPCGSFDALLAAIRSGADAVYLGMGDFNARQNAANFEGETLEKAAALCRLHGVKLYLTMNTLVSDDELPKFKSALQRACAVSADALIVQDLGAARLARALCPEMELHASTQMSVQTVAGVLELEKLGFSRVVLPREMTKEEIREIAENTSAELEVFVHGALCMSVSGQCLFSAVLGSRSGNRGRCAQPCRLPFSVPGGTGTDLSLKDLSLIDRLGELSEAGVTSFKIEGRMKRPEYVAAAVTACREALGNAYADARKSDLEALFSRSGFTGGYYDNRRGRAMFGRREKENVTSATNALLQKYENLYRKEQQSNAVSAVFTAEMGENISLSLSACGKNVFVESTEQPQAALHAPTTEERVRASLSKCGGTAFYMQEVECILDDNIAVAASVINALRREGLEKLEAAITTCPPVPFADKPIENLGAHTAKEQKLYLCFHDAENIPEYVSCDKLFVPLDTDIETVKRFGAGAVIPRGLFGKEAETLERLQNSPAREVLCGTLDAVAIAKKAGKTAIGGASLNTFNALTAEEYRNLGVSELLVSREMRLSELKALGGELPRGVEIYGRIPLMLTRNCPVRNGKTCAECKRQSSLTDRKGKSFPVRCAGGCSEIFNSVPVYMADRMGEIQNADFVMLTFTTETKSEIKQILEAYRKGLPPRGEFTRGLLYRGVE